MEFQNLSSCTSGFAHPVLGGLADRLRHRCAFVIKYSRPCREDRPPRRPPPIDRINRESRRCAENIRDGDGKNQSCASLPPRPSPNLATWLQPANLIFQQFP